MINPWMIQLFIGWNIIYNIYLATAGQTAGENFLENPWPLSQGLHRLKELDFFKDGIFPPH